MPLSIFHLNIILMLMIKKNNIKNCYLTPEKFLKTEMRSFQLEATFSDQYNLRGLADRLKFTKKHDLSILHSASILGGSKIKTVKIKTKK